MLQSPSITSIRNPNANSGQEIPLARSYTGLILDEFLHDG
jgi:hypothetical protein